MREDVDGIAVTTKEGHRPRSVTPPIDIVVGAKRIVCGVLALPDVDDGGTNQRSTFERRLASVALDGDLGEGGGGGGGYGRINRSGSACQNQKHFRPRHWTIATQEAGCHQ